MALESLRLLGIATSVSMPRRQLKVGERRKSGSEGNAHSTLSSSPVASSETVMSTTKCYAINTGELPSIITAPLKRSKDNKAHFVTLTVSKPIVTHVTRAELDGISKFLLCLLTKMSGKFHKSR